jgi:hypothetical protein
MVVPSAHASDASGKTQRLDFIDALRVTIVAFVIVHHAALAYGPHGGYWPMQDRAQSHWFLPFYIVNSAVGLGLLFLLAGYFVPGSYDRKGGWDFLRGRWIRLGVPLGCFLLAQLPTLYLLGSHPPLLHFVQRLYDQAWFPLYAHLWFVAHLLLYSSIYVVWRLTFDGSGKPASRLPPSHVIIVGFVLTLALIIWIVRIRYAVDVWVPFLWIMPAEPARLPQYVALFVVGVLAFRGDWFFRMPTTIGVIWLGIGLIAAAGVYVAYMGGILSKLMAAGGFNLSSLTGSIWETTIAAGSSVGLIVVFREVFRRRYRVLDIMAASSFAAYLLHPPIVLALQATIAAATLPAFVKFAIVSVLGTAVAFSVGHLAGKVPGVRTVLGPTSGGEASLAPGAR